MKRSNASLKKVAHHDEPSDSSAAAPTEDAKALIRFVENLKKQWLETIDALPDPFLIVGTDYVIQKANAAMADVADKPIKTLVGAKCYQVFAGRDKPCENCQMKRTQSFTQLQSYEVFNALNERWYEVVSKRVAGTDASNEGILQIYRDRTETRRLQHQVNQQEKLASIGQLAGGFAHEINNPLGGIIVFSQMLLREMETSSQHYQDVVEIESAAQRCKDIVDGLLNFARQRPIQKKLEPTDFHAAIESAVKFAGVGHNQKNRSTVELKLDAKEFKGIGDRNGVMQIILNLCTNAFQAMPNGGTLTVTSANKTINGQKHLVIAVSDTGTGISKDMQKKIYDPFFTTKEPGQGTGLGLSVVHGIIQDLGGTIELESKLKEGTTFRVMLPLSPTPKEDKA